MALQLSPRIIVDPAIRFGRPVIQGTRVPVDLVLAKLAAGMTAVEIANDYALALDDIQAVLLYAAFDHASYYGYTQINKVNSTPHSSGHGEHDEHSDPRNVAG